MRWWWVAALVIVAAVAMVVWLEFERRKSLRQLRKFEKELERRNKEDE
jgi:hypothetical protein